MFYPIIKGTIHSAATCSTRENTPCLKDCCSGLSGSSACSRGLALTSAASVAISAITQAAVSSSSFCLACSAGTISVHQSNKNGPRFRGPFYRHNTLAANALSRPSGGQSRSEEHTSELQSPNNLV